MQFPIIIISRDRLTCLQSLVDWLEKAGQNNIHIVDMASTYPPLLDYLSETPHIVHQFTENLGPRSLWPHTIDGISANGYYVVTDPDILPDEKCPLDVLDHFYHLLQQRPNIVKVGFSLRIDDLPDTYAFKKEVIAWENQFWQALLGPNIYSAAIDTTFALYRPHIDFTLAPSIRTAPPYVARHTSWYIDSSNLSEEDIYYREHLRIAISSWSKEELGDWYPL